MCLLAAIFTLLLHWLLAWDKWGLGRGRKGDFALRVDMKKVIYRLARGHQILEGEGDLGSCVPTRERKELYSSLFSLRDQAAARYVIHKPGLRITWPAWN